MGRYSWNEISELYEEMHVDGGLQELSELAVQYQRARQKQLRKKLSALKKSRDALMERLAKCVAKNCVNNST